MEGPHHQMDFTDDDVDSWVASVQGRSSLVKIDAGEAFLKGGVVPTDYRPGGEQFVTKRKISTKTSRFHDAFRLKLLKEYLGDQASIRQIIRRAEKYLGIQVPERFIDPYTKLVMVNPVRVVTADGEGQCVEQRTIRCTNFWKAPKVVFDKDLQEQVREWVVKVKTELKKLADGGEGLDLEALGGPHQTLGDKGYVRQNAVRNIKSVRNLKRLPSMKLSWQVEETASDDDGSEVSAIDSDDALDLEDNFALGVVKNMLSAKDTSANEISHLSKLALKLKAAKDKWYSRLRARKAHATSPTLVPGEATAVSPKRGNNKVLQVKKVKSAREFGSTFGAGHHRSVRLQSSIPTPRKKGGRVSSSKAPSIVVVQPDDDVNIVRKRVKAKSTKSLKTKQDSDHLHDDEGGSEMSSIEPGSPSSSERTPDESESLISSAQVSTDSDTERHVATARQKAFLVSSTLSSAAHDSSESEGEDDGRLFPSIRDLHTVVSPRGKKKKGRPRLPKKPGKAKHSNRRKKRGRSRGSDRSNVESDISMVGPFVGEEDAVLTATTEHRYKKRNHKPRVVKSRHVVYQQFAPRQPEVSRNSNLRPSPPLLQLHYTEKYKSRIAPRKRLFSTTSPGVMHRSELDKLPPCLIIHLHNVQKELTNRRPHQLHAILEYEKALHPHCRR